MKEKIRVKKMAQYVEDLENYEGLENTESCYLDGRYFNMVFQNYPALLTHPLYIDIRVAGIKSATRDEKKERYFVNMRENNIKTHMPGLLRLVIQTPKTRHSNLLILDYNNSKVFRFEPLGKNAPYYEKVNDLIMSYLGNFFPFDLEVIDIEFDEILDEKNPKCKKSGFCVAYNILYAYSYLKQISFDPANIRKFAKLIEMKYGPLPEEGRQVEYGPWEHEGYEHHHHYHDGYGGYGGYGYPPYGGYGGYGGYGYPVYGGYGYPAYGGYGTSGAGLLGGLLVGGLLGAAAGM
jgi:hypothetical protein